MTEPSPRESQLDRLLALDLSQMGYQARIRHQQRIDELLTRRAGGNTQDRNEREGDTGDVPEDEPAAV